MVVNPNAVNPNGGESKCRRAIIRPQSQNRSPAQSRLKRRVDFREGLKRRVD